MSLCSSSVSSTLWNALDRSMKRPVQCCFLSEDFISSFTTFKAFITVLWFFLNPDWRLDRMSYNRNDKWFQNLSQDRQFRDESVLCQPVGSPALKRGRTKADINMDIISFVVSVRLKTYSGAIKSDANLKEAAWCYLAIKFDIGRIIMRAVQKVNQAIRLHKMQESISALSNIFCEPFRRHRRSSTLLQW